MATRSVRVWFDPEADFLEVTFDLTRPGYVRETAHDRVMEKVAEDGTILGFSILGISSLRGDPPVEVELETSRS